MNVAIFDMKLLLEIGPAFRVARGNKVIHRVDEYFVLVLGAAAQPAIEA